MIRSLSRTSFLGLALLVAAVSCGRRSSSEQEVSTSSTVATSSQIATNSDEATTPRDPGTIVEIEPPVPTTSSAPPTPVPVESEADQQNATVQVVESYYAAINAHDYERAYSYWGAPAQTFEQFRDGFADTASVRAQVGTPSRIEGAAGSRYIDIPVTIVAQTTAGETQRFEGTYTLRKSVVDGASPAQRRWHIDRAAMRKVNG